MVQDSVLRRNKKRISHIVWLGKLTNRTTRVLAHLINMQFYWFLLDPRAGEIALRNTNEIKRNSSMNFPPFMGFNNKVHVSKCVIIYFKFY